jgi:hypothetical protein
MKLLKILMVVIIFIILVIVLMVGYYGFVPGLSTVMGADKPKDLGVKYTKAHYDQFSNKLNGDIIPITTSVSPAESITYSGKIDVNKDFSQEEISSRLNYGRWKYMPIKNVQVRINNDGSLEFSANLVMDRIAGFIEREGMGKWSIDDVSKGMNFIKLVRVDPPIYARLKASISNNQPNGNIEAITVGKFNVPLETVNANETAISLFRAITSKASSFYAKSVTFNQGKMHFEGTLPAKMMVEISN